MTRKDFLRVAGLTALAAGVEPVSAAERATARRLSGRISAHTQRATRPLIRTLDPVMRLYPFEAMKRTGEIRFGPAEIDSMLPFFGAGEITWSVTAPAIGAYRVAVCYAATKPGTQIEVSCGPSSIWHSAILTEGFFLPHAGGPAARRPIRARRIRTRSSPSASSFASRGSHSPASCISVAA